MAFNLAKQTWFDWRRHHNIVQSFNFVLGLIFVVTTLILLFAGDSRTSEAPQMSVYLLGVCGVLALWAGITDNERSVYIIDMLIGFLFISSSTGIAIFNDGVVRTDVIIGTLTGFVFFITAYRARNIWKQSKIIKKELIFEGDKYESH